jgi:hypothetical protein
MSAPLRHFRCPGVTPAEAGIQCFRLQERRCAARPLGWIPAFAGMTVVETGSDGGRACRRGTGSRQADGTSLKSYLAV